MDLRPTDKDTEAQGGQQARSRSHSVGVPKSLPKGVKSIATLFIEK